MNSPTFLEAGVSLFNEGRYYEAHEAWEDLWRETQGPLRRFYQGLVQAAVGLYHFNRRNTTGGEAQLRKAVSNLEGCPNLAHGLDAADLIRQLESVLAGKAAQGIRIARLK